MPVTESPLLVGGSTTGSQPSAACADADDLLNMGASAAKRQFFFPIVGPCRSRSSFMCD